MISSQTVPRQPVFAARASSKVNSPIRCSVRTAAQAQEAHVPAVHRRQAALAGVAALIAATQAAPAHAIFGLGTSAEEKYVSETTSVITDVRTVLTMDREAPTYDDAVKKVRKETNDWVAKYRRDNAFSGRPSFGNTYSALNALAGHYNSFGTNAPIPKKRLERIEKELGDAERLLERGR